MGQEIEYCDCNSPTPWEDNKGNKTNICKACSKRVPDVEDRFVPTPGDKGRILIAMEVAMVELGISQEEQELLWTLLLRRCGPWVKQAYKAGALNSYIRANTKN